MSPITQQEIDVLPAPPQEWLDEIDHLDRLHDRREQLETMLDQHDERYYDEALGKINITAHEFRAMDYEKQRIVYVQLGSVIEFIYGEHVSPYNPYHHIDIWCKTTSALMLGDRPRKKHYAQFDRFIHGINDGVLAHTASYGIEKHFDTTKIPDWMRTQTIHHLIGYWKDVDGIDHRQNMRNEKAEIGDRHGVIIEQLKIHDHEWWRESIYSMSE
mgnify:CR=1 FL=1